MTKKSYRVRNWQEYNKALTQRGSLTDEIIRHMRKHGRKGWKAAVNYHQRSLVETAFFRYKTLFGAKLRSHCLENQKIEALMACNTLNRFTQLGMPLAERIN